MSDLDLCVVWNGAHLNANQDLLCVDDRLKVAPKEAPTVFRSPVLTRPSAPRLAMDGALPRRTPQHELRCFSGVRDVLTLLTTTGDAYTCQEVMTRLSLELATVRSALGNLRRRGLVTPVGIDQTPRSWGKAAWRYKAVDRS